MSVLKRPRFLTSSAEVLVRISRDPDIRIRDLANSIGITERRAQVIVTELVETGYVGRERIGRRNRYSMLTDPLFTARLQATHGLARAL